MDITRFLFLGWSSIFIFPTRDEPNLLVSFPHFVVRGSVVNLDSGCEYIVTFSYMYGVYIIYIHPDPMSHVSPNRIDIESIHRLEGYQMRQPTPQSNYLKCNRRDKNKN